MTPVKRRESFEMCRDAASDYCLPFGTNKLESWTAITTFLAEFAKRKFPAGPEMLATSDINRSKIIDVGQRWAGDHRVA